MRRRLGSVSDRLQRALPSGPSSSTRELEDRRLELERRAQFKTMADAAAYLGKFKDSKNPGHAMLVWLRLHKIDTVKCGTERLVRVGTLDDFFANQGLSNFDLLATQMARAAK